MRPAKAAKALCHLLDPAFATNDLYKAQEASLSSLTKADFKALMRGVQFEDYLDMLSGLDTEEKDHLLRSAASTGKDFPASLLGPNPIGKKDFKARIQQLSEVFDSRQDEGAIRCLWKKLQDSRKKPLLLQARPDLAAEVSQDPKRLDSGYGGSSSPPDGPAVTLPVEDPASEGPTSLPSEPPTSNKNKRRRELRKERKRKFESSAKDVEATASQPPLGDVEEPDTARKEVASERAESGSPARKRIRLLVDADAAQPPVLPERSSVPEQKEIEQKQQAEDEELPDATEVTSSATSKRKRKRSRRQRTSEHIALPDEPSKSDLAAPDQVMPEVGPRNLSEHEDHARDGTVDSPPSTSPVQEDREIVAEPASAAREEQPRSVPTQVFRTELAPVQQKSWLQAGKPSNVATQPKVPIHERLRPAKKLKRSATPSIAESFVTAREQMSPRSSVSAESTKNVPTIAGNGSSKEPVEEPVPKPVERAVQKPAKKAVKKTVKEQVKRPVKGPAKEPVESPANRAIKQVVEEPVEEPVKPPVKSTVKSPVKSPVKKPVEGSVEEPKDALEPPNRHAKSLTAFGALGDPSKNIWHIPVRDEAHEVRESIKRLNKFLKTGREDADTSGSEDDEDSSSSDDSDDETPAKRQNDVNATEGVSQSKQDVPRTSARIPPPSRGTQGFDGKEVPASTGPEVSTEREPSITSLEHGPALSLEEGSRAVVDPTVTRPDTDMASPEEEKPASVSDPSESDVPAMRERSRSPMVIITPGPTFDKADYSVQEDVPEGDDVEAKESRSASGTGEGSATDDSSSLEELSHSPTPPETDEKSQETTTPRPRKRKATSKESPHFASSEKTKKRRVPAGVSIARCPTLRAAKFGLIQEDWWHDPFKLLLAVLFLNKTKGQHARPVFYELIARYPTPKDLANADFDEVKAMVAHLGLQNQRAKGLIKIAQQWVDQPPVKSRRYRTYNYPLSGDGAELKPKDTVEEDAAHCAGALEIGHLPGCGRYAWDSWRIFCRDVLRGVATGYNGEGTAPDGKAKDESFEPEWKRVLPHDKELRVCLRWMWLREGWLWNPLTGSKTLASAELMRRATQEETEFEVHGEDGDEALKDEVESPVKNELSSQNNERQSETEPRTTADDTTLVTGEITTPQREPAASNSRTRSVRRSDRVTRLQEHTPDQMTTSEGIQEVSTSSPTSHKARGHVLQGTEGKSITDTAASPENEQTAEASEFEIEVEGPVEHDPSQMDDEEDPSSPISVSSPSSSSSSSSAVEPENIQVPATPPPTKPKSSIVTPDWVIKARLQPEWNPEETLEYGSPNDRPFYYDESDIEAPPIPDDSRDISPELGAPVRPAGPRISPFQASSDQFIEDCIEARRPYSSPPRSRRRASTPRPAVGRFYDLGDGTELSLDSDSEDEYSDYSSEDSEEL